jgi:hypothetical protein
VQGAGGLGQVQVAAHGFLDEAKLVEVHNKYWQMGSFIMPFWR